MKQRADYCPTAQSLSSKSTNFDRVAARLLDFDDGGEFTLEQVKALERLYHDCPVIGRLLVALCLCEPRTYLKIPNSFANNYKSRLMSMDICSQTDSPVADDANDDHGLWIV
ncbi:hypothetical protein L1887_12572 [Cichorium endivia]|nr:hypothetical protein L1887_12572 [Cichorium endivia]